MNKRLQLVHFLFISIMLLELPQDILFEILIRLPYVTYKTLAVVSPTFNRLVTTEKLWFCVCQSRNFPINGAAYESAKTEIGCHWKWDITNARYYDYGHSTCNVNCIQHKVNGMLDYRTTLPLTSGHNRFSCRLTSKRKFGKLDVCVGICENRYVVNGLGHDFRTTNIGYNYGLIYMNGHIVKTNAKEPRDGDIITFIVDFKAQTVSILNNDVLVVRLASVNLSAHVFPSIRFGNNSIVEITS